VFDFGFFIFVFFPTCNRHTKQKPTNKHQGEKTICVCWPVESAAVVKREGGGKQKKQGTQWGWGGEKGKTKKKKHKKKKKKKKNRAGGVAVCLLVF